MYRLDLTLRQYCHKPYAFASFFIYAIKSKDVSLACWTDQENK